MNLYIHIPFCRKKCFYCDFYSVGYDKNIISSYVRVLCCQIERLTDEVSTIFIGGGTPTVLDTIYLEKLLKSLEKISCKADEFTIEANPESLDRRKLELFRRAGCKRISIGGQSFYEDKLKKLGRIHSVEDIKKSINSAREAGFENISIDMIFGVWEEKLDDWKKELTYAVTLPIKHISVYALTSEKNTSLFKAVKEKKIKLLDEDIAARMYKFTMKFLAKNGFDQYEVSNFSKKGYQCKHNLNYWENNPYIGLGPGAVSYRNGTREKNIENVKAYINKFENNENLVVSGEELSFPKQGKEFAALKIRTKEGINFNHFKERFNLDFLEIEKEALKELQKDKLIKYISLGSAKIGVCLTNKGFLFCDTVSSVFL